MPNSRWQFIIDATLVGMDAQADLGALLALDAEVSVKSFSDLSSDQKIDNNEAILIHNFTAISEAAGQLSRLRHNLPNSLHFLCPNSSARPTIEICSHVDGWISPSFNSESVTAAIIHSLKKSQTLAEIQSHLSRCTIYQTGSTYDPSQCQAVFSYVENLAAGLKISIVHENEDRTASNGLEIVAENCHFWYRLGGQLRGQELIIEFATRYPARQECSIASNLYHWLAHELTLFDFDSRLAGSQKALIQAEKLSVAGRLTASIAHEIKNPLQGVRNCLHLLGMPNLTPEQHGQYLEMTNQEMERLSNTVQQMLEFYKPNQDFKPLQVLEVLEHTINLTTSQMADANVKIRTIWPPKIPLILAIRDQIEQVLLNLLLNAKDALVEGGLVTVKIEVSKPFLAIVVEDNGPGVSAELRESIFEPFVSTKGTSGLGLSVSHEIIRNHHGTLELMDPIPGVGARFKIILPIKT